jgi:extracellular elastinolytic metalloproteinase
MLTISGQTSARLSCTEIGQIWANILHNIHAALVEKYGFSTSAMTNPNGTEGNIMFLHLFIDSLALLAADPTCKPH